MPLFSLFSGKREVSPSGESPPKRVKIEDQSADNEASDQPRTPVSAVSTFMNLGTALIHTRLLRSMKMRR